MSVDISQTDSKDIFLLPSYVFLPIKRNVNFEGIDNEKVTDIYWSIKKEVRDYGLP